MHDRSMPNVWCAEKAPLETPRVRLGVEEAASYSRQFRRMQRQFEGDTGRRDQHTERYARLARRHGTAIDRQQSRDPPVCSYSADLVSFFGLLRSRVVLSSSQKTKPHRESRTGKTALADSESKRQTLIVLDLSLLKRRTRQFSSSSILDHGPHQPSLAFSLWIFLPTLSFTRILPEPSRSQTLHTGRNRHDRLSFPLILGVRL